MTVAAPPRPSQRPPSALELIRSADSAEEAPPEAGSAPQAQPSGFSPEQLAALSAPLDAAMIRTLHGAIRQRFSIPEEATTIADRILQKRHHDWIEAFLVQHQAAT